MTITIGHITYEVRACINCGIATVVPRAMIEKLARSGGYFHCPNGHSQGWGKGDTEEDQIRRERDRLKQQAAHLEQLRLEAVVRAEHAERAAKSLKKKASAGVCPCCQRTVRQMALHMKTKHPTFRAEIGQ